MDKKAKKRIEVLRKKLKNCEMQLNGAKQQEDEPGEIEKKEAEIKSIVEEIDKLKKS